MSIAALSYVWESSRQEGGALLVLLAIADYANEHGLAYPATKTLARKARLSERQTQRVVKELEAAGEIEVHANKGPGGVNLYRIKRSVFPGDNLSGGDVDVGGGVTPMSGEGVTPMSPKPSLEPSLNHQRSEELFVEDSSTAFLNAWNSLPEPFPKIKVWSEKRKKDLRARMREKDWRANWRAALEALPHCPFLRGANDRKWIADVEFFLRPDSVGKIVEGKYAMKSDVSGNNSGANGAEYSPWWKKHL